MHRKRLKIGYQSFCLFVNIRDAQASYTNENDSLETGEKNDGRKSPWDGKRARLLKSSGETGLGHGKVSSCTVTRRNKEMRTDSFRLRNLVVGR